MLDENRVKILRSFGSWSLSAIGIWLMVGIYFVGFLGPRLISVAAMLASVFVVGFLLFRAGWSLK